MPALCRVIAVMLLAACPLAAQQGLSRTERGIRRAVAGGVEDQIRYLQRVVDMPSSTLDLDGVRAVGAVFARSLDSLGFETRWAEMPAAMRRAGHLIAERRGKPGRTRLLLIGHLDTVVRPVGATFARRDSVATGIGTTDMKGGDVVILYALKSLAAAGALRDLTVTVVFTGDEEHAGSPLDVSRGDLIAAAGQSDLALAFEGGHRSDLTVARRGAASWRVTTTHVVAVGVQVVDGAGLLVQGDRRVGEEDRDRRVVGVVVVAGGPVVDGGGVEQGSDIGNNSCLGVGHRQGLADVESANAAAGSPGAPGAAYGLVQVRIAGMAAPTPALQVMAGWTAVRRRRRRSRSR